MEPPPGAADARPRSTARRQFGTTFQQMSAMPSLINPKAK